MISGADKEQAEFNMSFSFLNRLNYLFYNADESALSLDAYGWFHVLMAIDRALDPLMNPEERYACMKYIAEINKELPTIVRLNTRLGRNEIPPALYSFLDKYQRVLSNNMQRRGLLMKMGDDPSRALR